MQFRLWFRGSLGKRLFGISLASVVGVIALAEVFAFPAYVDNLVTTKREAMEMSVRQSRDQLDYFLGKYVEITTKLNKDLRLRETLGRIVAEEKAGRVAARDQAVMDAQRLIQNEFDTISDVWGLRLFRWQPDGSYEGLENRLLNDPTLMITDDDSEIVQIDRDGERFLRQAADAEGAVVWDPAVPDGRFKDLLSLEERSSSFLLGKLLVNKVNPAAQYVLVLEFDPERFGDFLMEFAEAGDQHARVVDTAQKIIMYDPDRTRIGGPNDWRQPAPPPWMNREGKAGQGFMNAGGLPGLPPERKAQDARGGFLPGGPERFPRELLIYAPLTVAPWQVMTTINMKQLQDDAWASLWQLNLVLFGPALLIALLIAWYTKRAVARPMERLGQVLNAVGNPEVLPEQVPVKGNDELAGLAVATNRVAELVASVNAVSRQIRQLLDYSGQGFLSFGAQLAVEPAYSQACEWMLGERELAGKPVTGLLFQAEPDVMRDMLGSVFGAGAAAEREMYLSLFPTEIRRGNKVVEMSYRQIVRGDGIALMVVMTDVTLQRRLMEKIESESKMLQMIVKVVQQKADFFYTLDEWDRFVAEGCAALTGTGREVSPDEKSEFDERSKDKPESGQDWMDVFDELYRTVHTFKGSFGQFGFVRAAGKLHALETALSEAAESWEQLSDLRAHVQAWRLEEVTAEELEMLRDVLGEAFFTRNTGTVIDLERLRLFEKRIVEVLSENEAELVRAELRRLNDRPVKELLEGYPRFVAELAEGLEKFVYPMVVEGDDVLADPDKLRGWSQSLVHLFRNMLDHGLEGPDERLEAGKDETGSITCVLRQLADGFELTVSDDGRGINLARVRAKAVEKGLISAEAARALEPADVIAFIFADSFSTKEAVSELSGRGVGMSAVKAETEALGGTLSVESVAGRGTTMIFRIPSGS